MKMLIIKTSSMGDVIHTLPALSDAVKFLPSLRFDWVVEESFAEIPAWHNKVDKVLPVAWRRWRKSLWQSFNSSDWRQFWQSLRSEKYDFILDAQGLIKSAIISRLAKGKRYGYNFNSAREPIASCFYQQTYEVARQQHAVTRIRQLMAATLNYQPPVSLPDYGIRPSLLPIYEPLAKNFVALIHGTSRDTKLWPVECWIELAKKLHQQGILSLLPWGNQEEHQRAQQIANACQGAQVLPRLPLGQIAFILKQAKTVVAVDTGLGHMAAALGVPTLSLYGPTNPELIGTYGLHQYHLQANPNGYLGALSVEQVWLKLEPLLKFEKEIGDAHLHLIQ